MNASLQIAPETPLVFDHPPLAARLERIVLIGLVSVLLLGPLAFGAVEAWAIFLMEFSAAVLALLWVGEQIAAGELKVVGHPLFAPMLVFLGLVLFQLLPGRSEYRYDTVQGLLLYCTYGVFCFLIVQSVRRTPQVKALGITIVVYGGLVALFGLFQGISSTNLLYWFRVPSSGGWVYGPYVNHNHYAGLMEMLLPFPLVLAFSDLLEGNKKTLAAAVAAVMATTIFLCGSRGGMLAFTVEVLLLGAILIRGRKSRKMAWILGFFLAIVMVLLVWIGGEQLSERIASIQSETKTELDGGLRVQVGLDSLKMFLVKPFWGFGLGTFPDIYPRYRSFYTEEFVNQAHDDYAQLLVEMGALGFATMLWFMGSVYYRAVKKLKNWQTDTNGVLGLAAMLGCTGIMVHSFFDFNLQIPANAALFYVLCTLAALDPRFALIQRRSRGRRRKPQDELSV